MSTRVIHRVPALTVLLLVATAGTAQAQDVSLPFTPTFTIGSTSLTNDDVQANADGSYTMSGQQAGGSFNGGQVWDLAWDVTIKQDPFIIGSLTVTNLTTTTRNFNLALALPITPAFSPSVFGGSVTATVLDLNGDRSATLSPNAAVSPGIFRGTIDGNLVLPLFGMVLNCAGSSAGCTANATDSDGMPGLTLPGPSVNNSIGILLSFTLSPGDRAFFNTNFTVEPLAPVPVPAALPLLALALGAGATALHSRRRRGDLAR